MLKTGEMLYDADDKLRTRIIFNPEDAVKVYVGWISHNVVHYLKKVLPGFVSGCNME